MVATAPFTVVVDSREQRPYTFTRIKARVRGENVPIHVPTSVATLPTADYSLENHEREIAIERKGSLEELCTCVGADRDRFEDELERMAAIPSAHLMLEFSFHDIFQAATVSKISRRSVAGSLLAWSHRFKIRVWFAGKRSAAEWLTYQLLHRFHDDHVRREAGEVLGPGSAVVRDYERGVREHEKRCREVTQRPPMIPPSAFPQVVR